MAHRASSSGRRVALVVSVMAAAGAWTGSGTIAASAATFAASAAAAELTSVVCPSVTVCEATASNSAQTLRFLFRTTDGGRHWERQALPGGLPVSSVACPTATICQAGVASASVSLSLRTIDGGRTWSEQKLLPGANIELVACPSADTCEAVGEDAALRTTDGGKTWVTQKLPNALYQSVGLACPRVTVCQTVGWSSGFSPIGVVVGTTEGGKVWRSEHIPTKQPPAAVSCPSAATCEIALSPPFAGGPANAQALRTTNAGASWKQQSIADGFVATGISCPTPTTCQAVGGTALSYGTDRTVDGGSRWEAQGLAAPSGTFEGDAVACPSLSTCVAVGSLASGSTKVGSTAWTHDGGKHWAIAAP